MITVLADWPRHLKKRRNPSGYQRCMRSSTMIEMEQITTTSRIMISVIMFPTSKSWIWHQEGLAIERTVCQGMSFRKSRENINYSPDDATTPMLLLPDQRRLLARKRQNPRTCEYIKVMQSPSLLTFVENVEYGRLAGHLNTPEYDN